MKKLEEIPKKNLFKVPDGYFDKLPGIIQSRVAAPTAPLATPWLRSLSYALPVALLMVIGIFWYRSVTPTTFTAAEIEAELAEIQPGQMASYLEDRDLTTEELVETVTWSNDDLDDLESSVFSALEFSNQELEKMIDEYDEL